MGGRRRTELAHVADGGEVVVTMRGRPVARLSPLEGRDPLAQLRARGLVSEPTGEWDELWSTSALRISSQLVYP